MIVINSTSSDDSQRCVVALFGLGLIGREIANACLSRAGTEAIRVPFQWTDRSSRLTDLSHVEAAIHSSAKPGSRVDFVWSAGKAGFMSNDGDTQTELETFREALTLAERVAERQHVTVTFHLISSAGGLFEGRCDVTRKEKPAPRRPYGRLKLAEEELVTSCRALSAYAVYRVASTYGHLRRGSRAGLVTQLISDGLLRRVTHISGKMATLRDFVFAADVGQYVASKIFASERDAGIFFLARTRPACLFEVQHIVERTMGRKLYVVYSVESNAADITFAPDVSPSDWHPSELQPNVGSIYRRALSSGEWSL